MGANVKGVIDGVNSVHSVVPLVERQCTATHTDVQHVRILTHGDLRDCHALRVGKYRSGAGGLYLNMNE